RRAVAGGPPRAGARRADRRPAARPAPARRAGGPARAPGEPVRRPPRGRGADPALTRAQPTTCTHPQRDSRGFGESRSRCGRVALPTPASRAVSAGESCSGCVDTAPSILGTVAGRLGRDGIRAQVASGTAQLRPDPDRRAGWTLLLDGTPQSHV